MTTLTRKAITTTSRIHTYFSTSSSPYMRRFLCSNANQRAKASTAGEEALIDLPKHVLYEDTQLLIVSKPPGVLSQGDLSQEDNIVDAVRRYFGNAPQFPRPVVQAPLKTKYVHLVHRLDRPASGLLCLAKTQIAARRLGNAFKNRKVAKHYLCVVNGEMKTSTELQHNLLMKSDKGVKIVTESYLEKNPHLRKSVLPARLTCRPLYTMQHDVVGPQSLIHVTLDTGRKHQIRAQLAHTGFPVVGDARYGAPSRLKTREISLHAHSLEFEHPTTKATVQVQAPVPESWQKLFSTKLVAAANSFTPPKMSKGKPSS